MIPTIEQVRTHAESYTVEATGGGLWLLRWWGHPPELRVLRANDSRIDFWSNTVEAWVPAFIHSYPESAIACDQAGNPLPLVDDVAFLRAELERVRSGASQAIATCEHERAGLEVERDTERARAESFHQALQRAEAAELAALAEADEWRVRVEQAEARLSVVLGLPNCTLAQACAALEKAATNDREAYL